MNDREFLRHTLATLAYRASKAIRNAPESFALFKASPSSRTPREIVSHMADLFDWAYSMAIGEPKWNSSEPQDWKKETERFFASLKKFDDLIGGTGAIQYELTRLFQGPVADALTHTGQLTLLRRMAGSPVKGESYNRAHIESGIVGAEQTPADPRYEFD